MKEKKERERERKKTRKKKHKKGKKKKKMQEVRQHTQTNTHTRAGPLTHPGTLPIVRRQPFIIQVIHIVPAHLLRLRGQVAENVLLVAEEFIVVYSDQLVFCTAERERV